MQIYEPTMAINKLQVIYPTFLGLFFLILVVAVHVSCQHFTKNNTHLHVSDASIAEGKVLARQYCQSCHQLPNPSMLSSGRWDSGVLPQMGPRLGIFYFGNTLYPSSVQDPNIGSSFYPRQPIMSFENWQSIINYYTSVSPDSLIAGKKDAAIIESNQLFLPVTNDSFFSYYEPVIGCVYADTLAKPCSILVADINKGNILSIDKKAKPIDSIQYRSPIASMVMQNDTLVTANIGITSPNDGQTGTIQQLKFHNGKFLSQPVKLITGLRRPVHIDLTDLNHDGLKDILVCEYGNLKGALSWLENEGNNQYKRHVIREQPGAIATVVKDFNHDGLPDFYVLFAQGDEQIIRFENKGNGSFEARQLLRFPPMYGSSYFEMDDINKDGIDDIVYTCGDNADYSIELKPYHGVYIFINDGKDNFKQQYFFHINGCFKAMARDFDGDGNLDIAAISFFADYRNRPEEGFVYLQNKGNYWFTPYSVAAAKEGRWISMDVKDIDGDGKPDIILGNFSFKSFIPSSVDWKKQPAFLLLKNNMP